MKKLLIPAFVALAYLQMGGCATTSSWESTAASVASSGLANMAVTTVAKHYGGEKAGELASAGLSATADVLQGYVNKQPPIDIVTQSPGVAGLGKVMVNWLVDRGTVTQQTVNDVHKAAELASGVTK